MHLLHQAVVYFMASNKLLPDRFSKSVDCLFGSGITELLCCCSINHFTNPHLRSPKSMKIYERVVQKTLEQNLMSKSDRILVVCAGNTDRQVFMNAGFKNVAISNLDYHGGVKDYEPFEWELQDAEAIEHLDNSFDWVAVHAGLHHCASPHKAMCEMLRVSRKGILVVEARDSILLRVAVRLGLVCDYEIEPVAVSGGVSGGYRNSAIPNFVYRWTEREIKKTINSYSPEYKHQFSFHYGYRVPIQRLSISPNRLKRWSARFFKVLLPVVKCILPKQGNEFAFVVTKQGALHDWLSESNDSSVVPNMEYLDRHFRVQNYDYNKSDS